MKGKHKKPRGRKRNNPRNYWVQFHRRDDELEHVRKFCTYDMACAFTEITLAERTDLQAAYLLSGALEESELIAPPKQAVWERWESADQEGTERRGLCPAYDPMNTLKVLARRAS